jgi:hypothetical protein
MDRINVRRKFDFLLGAAACCAVLTSCGGGGTPTPSPTPTSSPTPTPTTTATPVVFNFTSDFTVVSSNLLIYANFTPTGGTEVFNDGSLIGGSAGLNFVFNPEKVVTSFPDLTTNPEFSGSDLVGSSANQRAYANGTTSLTLDVPFTNVLRSTYLRTDPFTSGTTPGTLTSRRVSLYFLPITTTTAIASPLTYTGNPLVIGGTKGTTVPGTVTSAAATFTVTPAATATGTPTLTGTIRIVEPVNGVPTERAVLPFSASVTSTGTFSSTTTAPLADTANGFSGGFAGTLAGPNREEILFTFGVTHATDGRRYFGSFIGD